MFFLARFLRDSERTLSVYMAGKYEFKTGRSSCCCRRYYYRSQTGCSRIPDIKTISHNVERLRTTTFKLYSGREYYYRCKRIRAIDIVAGGRIQWNRSNIFIPNRTETVFTMTCSIPWMSTGTISNLTWPERYCGPSKLFWAMGTKGLTCLRKCTLHGPENKSNWKPSELSCASISWLLWYFVTIQ